MWKAQALVTGHVGHHKERGGLWPVPAKGCGHLPALRPLLCCTRGPGPPHSQVLAPGAGLSCQFSSPATDHPSDGGRSQWSFRIRIRSHLVRSFVRSFIRSFIQHTCQAWGKALRRQQASRNINSLLPCKTLPPTSSLIWAGPPSLCSRKHSVFICILHLLHIRVILLLGVSFPLRQGPFPTYLCIPSAWHRARVSAGVQSLSLSLYLYSMREWLNSNTTSHRLQMVIHRNNKYCKCPWYYCLQFCHHTWRVEVFKFFTDLISLQKYPPSVYGLGTGLRARRWKQDRLRVPASLARRVWEETDHWSNYCVPTSGCDRCPDRNGTDWTPHRAMCL